MDLQKLLSNFAATENRPKGFQDSAFTALSDSNPPQLGLDLVQERDAEMGFDRCLNAPILMNYQKNLKRGGWPAEGRNGVTKVCSRGHWRPQEDAKLKELVNKFGPHNWNLIAQNLQGRSGKSCRLRWFNQLDPRINRRAFSEEEEERLLSAHKMYGNKWATIARMFPGRTDNAVKNHWHVIMARKRREEHCVYRRKMPSSSFSFLHLQLQQNTHQSTNNVNINIVDDQLSAASTCTHLSLTPSSLKTPHFLTRFHHQDLLYSPAGKEGKGPENQDDDQLGYSSESKSEVCAASESVANNEANLYMCGEDESGKFDMGFIDFLGVGAT
ncbi:Transcription factor [Sesamum alatum]|uniref:Transcription factor n=1 Tax=Sesamum alatum TaxID=300844 RepID=A0AAE1YL21_9LAMI|nr:Transcription factor [Sesamum alatum]